MNFTFWDSEVSEILLVAPIVIFVILALVVIIIFLTGSHNYRGWDWSDGWEDVKPGALVAVMLFAYICIYGYFFVNAFDWLDKEKLQSIYSESVVHKELVKLKEQGYVCYKVSSRQVILKNPKNGGPEYKATVNNINNRCASSWVVISDANDSDREFVRNGYDSERRTYCVYNTYKPAEMRYINKLIWTHLTSFPEIEANDACNVSFSQPYSTFTSTEDSIDVTVHKQKEDKRNITLDIVSHGTAQ